MVTLEMGSSRFRYGSPSPELGALGGQAFAPSPVAPRMAHPLDRSWRSVLAFGAGSEGAAPPRRLPVLEIAVPRGLVFALVCCGVLAGCDAPAQQTTTVAPAASSTQPPSSSSGAAPEGSGSTPPLSAASLPATPKSDPLSDYLAAHPPASLDPQTQSALNDCHDLRAVLAIADSRTESSLQRFVVDALESTGVLRRVRDPNSRGEIALDAAGWGVKSFSIESSNRSAVLARCPDLATCQVALRALAKQPPYASPTMAHPAPFLVCGVPRETFAFGQPVPLSTAR